MSDKERNVPKVFISHASEDKADYAEPLATILRTMGLDAWLDKWEIGPGDSLIQKIFGEGIHGTDAVVIILSETSISKPWVQKELNISAVKNIQNALRLIPVRIDNSEVPDVLQDLYWIDWNGEGSAFKVAERIADQLFGNSQKPPLQEPPPRLSTPKFTIPGLHPQDIKVLEVIFRASLDEQDELIQHNAIMPLAEKEGISFEQVKESIEMLESKGFLTNEDQTIAQRHIIVKFNSGQHIKLGESFDLPIEEIIKKLVAAVVNGQSHSLFDLCNKQPNAPHSILGSIIRVLAANGFWRTEGTIDGNLHIHGVSVTATRWLQENT